MMKKPDIREKLVLGSLVLCLFLLTSACGHDPQGLSAFTEDTALQTEASKPSSINPNEADKTQQPLSPQKESEHFILHCTEADISALEDIIQILESGYESTTSALQVQIDDKVDVYIYPNLKAFHSAIGRPNSPDWLVGIMATLRSIKMVSPGNPGPAHDYDSVIQVALHEFVHIAASQVKALTPTYLGEGVATYMAGQSQGVAEFISWSLAEASIPTLGELRVISGDEGLYQYAYAFVEYMVVQHGYEKLIEFYKSPNDTKGVLGVSEEDLHADWVAYLAATYG